MEGDSMIIYLWKGDNRSYGFSPEVWSGNVLQVEVPESFSGGNKTYNAETGEWITDPPYLRTHEDDVRDAEARRRNLIAEAEKTMAGWILDLNLGLISEEDKQKLIAWRLYVKELDALELDAAPDIEWPPRPQN
jgi:hypothetical protein